ncbi:MAG TPA: hypothetical protein VK661_12970 [Planctomycetota bacterium]|nr:hypothetical protein [Planctomycetota bacterium]
MAKAILYVSIMAAGALISFLWYMLGRGTPAALNGAACILALGVAMPILVRKDFQFVGIPGPVDLGFALASLVMGAIGGSQARDSLMHQRLLWAALLLLSVPAIRISLVTLKAYQRPLNLKIAVGVLLAALFGLNIFLGVHFSSWAAETSVTLVKGWFPDATASGPPPAPGPVPVSHPPGTPPPPPPPPPPPVNPGAPVAIVAGRPLTRAMLEYQLFIDSLAPGATTSDRGSAVAALLRAYTMRALLEKKFKAFDPAALKDERQWLMNQVKDKAVLHRIRTHVSDEMFLDVYVGGNGLYDRMLRDVFIRKKAEELRARVEAVVREVKATDGVERPGPKIEGVEKSVCRYSFRRREFVPQFEAEEEEGVKPDPRDDMAKKLATLKVNTLLSDVLWGDINARVIRRLPDDFKKRTTYEVYFVKQDEDFPSWFLQQSSDLAIEIPDPELRKEMLEQATSVKHIIKTK